MDNRNSGRIKKYGVCLNDKCSQYKVVQEIMHGNLECPECKKKLSPCAPPKKKNNSKPIVVALISLLCIGAIIGGIFVFSKKTVTNTEQTIVEEVIINNTQKEESVVDKAATPVEPKKTASDDGVLNLSYGTYTGATKDGYPHGQGRLTYTKSRQINRNDIKNRIANEGDYVIGEFFNGFVVYGKLYDSNGNLLRSLNFGVGSENSYDSK